MEAIELATNIAIFVEVLVAIALVFLNYREVRFLRREVEPLVEAGEPAPLYEALSFRASYITFVCIWLLSLTGLAAAGLNLAELFPPLRAINGALVLGLLAGPIQTGYALRKRVGSP